MHTSHVLDTCLITAGTLIAAAGTLVVSQNAETAAQANELKLFLLPLIGAMLASGGAIMLNPQPETRRIVIGRGIIALATGTVFPQFLAVFYPSLEAITMKPVVPFVFGACASIVAYIASKPLFAQLYSRADGLVKAQMDRAEALLPGSHPASDTNPQK